MSRVRESTKKRPETAFGEGEELGQSTSNDVLLTTEHATADVFISNNISPRSKQSINS